MQAVVFDVDDTLYDQQAPFRKAVKALVPQVLAADFHPLYLRFRYYSDENFPKVMTGELTLVEMRNQRIIESLVDLDYPRLTTVEALRFQKLYEDELQQIQLHTDIAKTLDYLKARQIPIGIITNGPTDHQYKKIKQLQVENWVAQERIIISEATGYQKPEVEIFQIAQNLFGFTPAETLYVGDSFESDVAGCKKAGWQSLWFNHRLRQAPIAPAHLPDFEIQSFPQLLTTLQEIF